MAAIDFPNSPTDGQTFTSAGLTWTYRAGIGWVLESTSTGGGSGFTFNQDSQPTATKVGDTWYETDTGDSFVWTNDGNSTQWVQFAPGSGGGSSSGGTGGIVAYAEVTASQASITALVDLTGLTATFIAVATHTYKITAQAMPQSTVAGDVSSLYISYSDDGTRARQDTVCTPANWPAGVTTSYVTTGLAGSQTYKLRMNRASGTGTVTNVASSSFRSFILVEDITYGASGGGGGSGDGGSGFTFVQETKPTPTKVGDTWFDLSTAATGGTSWVAVEEGAAGSEIVWVQFAPGTAATSVTGNVIHGTVFTTNVVVGSELTAASLTLTPGSWVIHHTVMVSSTTSIKASIKFFVDAVLQFDHRVDAGIWQSILTNNYVTVTAPTAAVTLALNNNRGGTSTIASYADPANHRVFATRVD